MNSVVFGELQYEYGWNGKVTLDWYGESREIDLLISGEADEEIDPLQCDSFQTFNESWTVIEESLLNEILSYYVDLRADLGYSDNSNEEYPEITDNEEIKKMITLDMVVIPLSGIYNGRSVGLAFSCDWNPENGLGVLLVDEKINEIGYSDIVF